MIYCLRNMIYDKSYDIFAAGCDIMSVPIIYRRYISPVLKRTDIIEKKRPHGTLFFLVPVAGVEPARVLAQRILSPPRLPIPTHRPVACLL